jgi:hypothetical protein
MEGAPSRLPSHPEPEAFMRYFQPPADSRFYAGVDLHARSLFLCAQLHRWDLRGAQLYIGLRQLPTRVLSGSPKAELALLKAQLAKDQSEENKVMDIGKEFIQLLRANRSDKAYQLTSASFQKKLYPLGLPDAPELRKSDPLLQKYPAIMRLEAIEHRQHKLKKSPDSKTYEYFCHAREIDATTLALGKNYTPGYTIEVHRDPGRGPWVELTVTIIQENGAWKVDKLEADKEVP